MSRLEGWLLRLAAMLPHAMTLNNPAYLAGHKAGVNYDAFAAGSAAGVRSERERQERIST